MIKGENCFANMSSLSFANIAPFRFFSHCSPLVLHVKYHDSFGRLFPCYFFPLFFDIFPLFAISVLFIEAFLFDACSLL